MYCDFHTHCFSNIDDNQKKCISLYDKENLDKILKMDLLNDINIFLSAGVHPWYISDDFFKYVKSLFEDDKCKISCVGEIGFDFVKNTRFNVNLQQEFFERQIFLAIEKDLPVIFHNVKGFHQFVKNIDLIKKLKSCVFHGFSGTYDEALYFLRHGVNALFSFGKSLLNNSKNSLNSFSRLPLECVGLETDSENHSDFSIENVYQKAFEVKQLQNQDEINMFMLQIEHNFDAIFT